MQKPFSEDIFLSIKIASFCMWSKFQGALEFQLYTTCKQDQIYLIIYKLDLNFGSHIVLFDVYNVFTTYIFHCHNYFYILFGQWSVFCFLCTYVLPLLRTSRIFAFSLLIANTNTSFYLRMCGCLLQYYHNS